VAHCSDRTYADRAGCLAYVNTNGCIYDPTNPDPEYCFDCQATAWSQSFYTQIDASDFCATVLTRCIRILHETGGGSLRTLPSCMEHAVLTLNTHTAGKASGEPKQADLEPNKPTCKTSYTFSCYTLQLCFELWFEAPVIGRVVFGGCRWKSATR
jgi:hypothetical protein